MIAELRFDQSNLEKHSVTTDEVEDCFLDSARLDRRIAKDIYWLIARTQAGRLLQIGYKKEPDNVLFVFHAMNAKTHEQKQYKRRGK